MFKFIGGALFGATVSLFFAALLFAAKEGDKKEEVKKRGEWLKIHLSHYDYVDRFQCSICENIVCPYPENIDSFLYCPNCGAKMDLNGGANNE